MRVHFEKILKGETLSFACREFRCRSFTSPYHIHPEFELTTILTGTGRRFVGDSIEEYYPGDLVLLGSNLPHRWASMPLKPRGPLSHSIVLQFKIDCFGKHFWNLPELGGIRRLLERAGSGLCFNSEGTSEITSRMIGFKALSGPERVLGMLEILLRLSKHGARHLASRNYRLDIAAQDIARIDRVINYVEANFSDETLNLSRAAQIASLTPSSFSRFFARSTGHTFVDFVNEVRISHVSHLLIETELPVSEICFACGFGTMSNFHQRFRESKHLTPLAYRRLFDPSKQVVPLRFSVDHR